MSAVNIIMLMFAIFINASYAAFFIEFIFKCLLFFNINVMAHLTWMHVSFEFIPVVIAYAIIACIYVIYWTPVCDYFIVRKYSRIEGGLIMQYFKDICAAAGKNAEKYRLYVNKGSYNAYAFKKDIVVIGSELFMKNEGEIKGVLAHEMGHLHYGDSLFWGLFWNMNAVNAFVLNFFYRLAYVLQVLGRVPIPFLNMALWCAGWIVLLTAKINEFIMNFPVYAGAFLGCRKSEYRADRYACELGFGSGLYKYLSTVAGEQQGYRRKLFFETHPKTSKRLDKIYEFCSSLEKSKLEF